MHQKHPPPSTADSVLFSIGFFSAAAAIVAPANPSAASSITVVLIVRGRLKSPSAFPQTPAAAVCSSERQRVANLSWFHSLALAATRNLSCLLYTSPSPRDRTRSRM